jgi:hypothetical protein
MFRSSRRSSRPAQFEIVSRRASGARPGHPTSPLILAYRRRYAKADSTGLRSAETRNGPWREHRGVPRSWIASALSTATHTGLRNRITPGRMARHSRMKPYDQRGDRQDLPPSNYPSLESLQAHVLDFVTAVQGLHWKAQFALPHQTAPPHTGRTPRARVRLRAAGNPNGPNSCGLLPPKRKRRQPPRPSVRHKNLISLS